MVLWEDSFITFAGWLAGRPRRHPQSLTFSLQPPTPPPLLLLRSLLFSFFLSSRWVPTSGEASLNTLWLSQRYRLIGDLTTEHVPAWPVTTDRIPFSRIMKDLWNARGQVNRKMFSRLTLRVCQGFRRSAEFTSRSHPRKWLKNKM